MKIEQLIREKVSFLSAGQKKVAEYILQHLDSFSYSTLAKLSKEISVSETTIIRLAYSLGFESFSEMQRTVQNDILSVPTVTKDDSLLDSGNFYQNIIANELHSMESWASHLNQEDMDQIVTHLSNAKKRLIVGARSSYSAALWMGTLLNQLLGNTKVVHEFYDSNFEYLTEASEDTVVLSDLFCPLYQMVSEICTDCQKSWCKDYSPSQTAFHHRHGRWQTTLVITEINLNEMGFNSFSCLYCLFDSIVAKIRQNQVQDPSVHDFMTWKNFIQTFDLFYE